MKWQRLLAGAILALAAATTLASDDSTLLNVHIDWPNFLARHDLVWNKMPGSWRDAAFLGNGRLALSVQQEPGKNAIRFAVDRTDVYDRRDDSWGWTAYSRPRYHVGDFLLEPEGKLTGCQMRLDLYNAELRGVFTTDKGQIKFRAFVHATDPVFIIGLEPDNDEQACQWRFMPFAARTTRDNGGVKNEAEAKKYEERYGHKVKVWVPNPEPRIENEEGVHLCVQELLAGGGYTTAWRELVDDQGKRTLYISIAMSHPELTSPRQARDAVALASWTSMETLTGTHRAWWHAFYPASFISLTETKVESFYWIQMYKYACAARADTGVIDTHGPWFRPTGWPYTTMDMNTQISYWALNTANRLENADSLYRNLDEKFDNLISNVRPVEQQKDAAAIGLAVTLDFNEPIDNDMRYRVCMSNLPWVCHNYWQFYRHTMNDERLRKNLYPLLRRAINQYLYHLEEDEHGTLHLKTTFAPEYFYANEGLTRDAHIDLALLKWGCQTLLQVCKRLKIDDPLIPRWQDVLQRLTDFPVDEYGFMVGRDIPFRHEHRHLSHLMAIYPLQLVHWEQPDNRDLIKLSLAKSTRDRHAGDYLNFTAAWAACMYAGMGDSETAYRQFRISLDTMFPNTMFAFSGQNIETPFVTVQPIHEMLLQCWNGAIRIFPATPKEWPDVVFHDLRTEGAFLVSGCRREGKTQWIRIKSLAGEPCRLKTDLPGPLRIVTGDQVTITPAGDATYDIDLARGQEVVLTSQDSDANLTIKPVAAQPGRTNLYGLP